MSWFASTSQKQRFFWWLGIFVILGLSALGSMAARYIAQLDYFQFRTVVLRKAHETQIPLSRVTRAVQKNLTGGYFTADLKKVKQALESLPWVARATVRRVYPNTLVVDVEPYQAIALYEDGRLVSQDGVLFQANPEEADHVGRFPNFYGPLSQVQSLALMYRRLSQVFSKIDVQISDLQISDRGTWSLVFSSARIPPTKVEYGRERIGFDSLLAQTEKLVQVYPKIYDMMKGPPASIDMRYNKALAVAKPDRQLWKAWLARPENQVNESDNNAEKRE